MKNQLLSLLLTGVFIACSRLAFSVATKHGQDMGGNGCEGTFRWGGYFNTSYFADPEEQLIGILMKQTQLTDRDDTGWKFSILARQAIND